MENGNSKGWNLEYSSEIEIERLLYINQFNLFSMSPRGSKDQKKKKERESFTA